MPIISDTMLCIITAEYIWNTDIQLMKNLDEFLDKDFFCSIEGDIFWGENIPESAFLGGVKGHPIFKRMLDIYNSVKSSELTI